jgi:Tfp pilus assembly protein PilZ
MFAQPAPRYRKRLPCRVRVGESQYSGVITNLSRSGLFVQTGAGAAPGERIEVAVQAPTAVPELVLASRVIWKRAVPPSLRNTLAGGIGVALQQAPEAWHSLLDAVERLHAQQPRPRRARGQGDTQPFAREPARVPHRVRLQQIGSPRSRTIVVEASSDADARRRALDRAGLDWTVTRVERLPQG